jgi:hypothetical protein
VPNLKPSRSVSSSWPSHGSLPDRNFCSPSGVCDGGYPGFFSEVMLTRVDGHSCGYGAHGEANALPCSERSVSACTTRYVEAQAAFMALARGRGAGSYGQADDGPVFPRFKPVMARFGVHRGRNQKQEKQRSFQGITAKTSAEFALTSPTASKADST